MRRWLFIPVLTLAVVFSMAFRTPSVFAAANPTVVGTCSAQFNDSSATTNSFSFTVAGGHSNIALLVFEGLAGASGENATGITYPKGGSATAMTSLTALTGAQEVGGNSWFLANPDVGTANVITTQSSSPEFAIICQIQDVVQSSPQDVAAVQTNTGGATSMSQSIVTVTDGDLLFGWGVVGGPASSLTAGGSATAIANYITNSRPTFAEYLAQAAHGSQAVSFSWTTSTIGDWYVIALKYQAPPATAVQRRRQPVIGF